MKTSLLAYPCLIATRLLARTAFPVFCCLVPSLLFAQGPLTPPGPPAAPTMKALDQVEARTIIDSLPFVITAPGSFYLTKNLSVTSGNGITINSDDVSIDLNGFTISSSEATPAGTGITTMGGGLSGRANISIRNGTIRGNVTGPPFSSTGFLHGIRPAGISITQNTRVSNVTVFGCMGDGILLSETSNVIENCTVRSVGGRGITGDSVQNCTARLCGTGGISGATVINCVGDCVTGWGIFAGTATNCKGSVSNGSVPTGGGIFATNAINCIGEDNSSAVGIQGTSVRNCNALSRFGKAIVAKIVDGCFASCFGTGTTATAIEATIVANSYGETGSGRAIIATVVSSSVGETTSGVSGILAGTVSNSFGSSGGTGQVFGIDATNTGVVQNSVGTATPTSPTSIGISARVTSYSRGSGHTGIAGGNVIGSFGTGNGGGANITGLQFLPP